MYPDRCQSIHSCLHQPLMTSAVRCHILLLLSQVRQRFEAAGGTVFQFTAAEAAHVHPNGVALQLPPKAASTGGSNGSGNGSGSSSTTQPQKPITGRLLVDCMVSCRLLILDTCILFHNRNYALRDFRSQHHPELCSSKTTQLLHASNQLTGQ
jgi:hypothetical protein